MKHFCFFCDCIQMLKILLVISFGGPKLLTLKSPRKGYVTRKRTLYGHFQ